MINHVLQNGFPKSGNYWLYTLLNGILDEAEVPNRSFISNHPISAVAKDWELSYPDQASMNVIDIEAGKSFCRIGSYFREPIDDLDYYIDQTRLVWTHSPFIARSREIYSRFDRVVYIVRDPRDVAISMAHFAFTPYRRKTRHTIEPNPNEYLKTHLLRHVTGWVNHVASHLLALDGQNFYILFYERLKSEFDQEMKSLLDYLDVELKDEQLSRIRDKVSIDKMKQRAGKHVRSGRSGGWRNTLTPGQVRQARMVAGPLLKELGYPLTADQEFLPQLPAEINRARVRRALRRALLTRGLHFVRSNAYRVQNQVSNAA